MLSRTNILVLALALGAASIPGSGASAQRASATADSVGRAVQGFYSWYVPMAARGGEGAPWMRAVRERRAMFAPALIAALRRDSVAGARNPDEVVGLDGDPFTNSQDPCERYVVRGVRRAGQLYLVSVVGVGGCGRHTQPDVVVEVARRAGGWRFENFTYANPAGDLLALLRSLQSH